MLLPVETVDESLDAWFVEMTQHWGCLSRLLTQHHHVGVDQSEGVDDDLPLDALDGVHDHGHGAVGQGLEALLRVDIHAGEPTTEAGVGMVPTNLKMCTINNNPNRQLK